MILSSLSLKNIRRHVNVSLSFGEKLNYIIGGNGLGKTTILESIYYLCTTKSCSSKSDSEVIRFGEDLFEIEGNFIGLTSDIIKLNYSLIDNKKNYFLNNKLISRASSIIGMFPVVLLTPADQAVTQGFPGDRRRFIDSVISQANKTYLEILLDYNRTLKHRSSLLSRIKEGRSVRNEMELEAWTQKLIANGEEIIKRRIIFIDIFNEYLKKSYFKIMGAEEVPEILYSYLGGYGGNNIREQFNLILEEKREEELRRATNLVGPHRDDFIFKINGFVLKTYGSQGQHKTFKIALRFAEFFYLQALTENNPIFLMDDVFSELDLNRASKTSDYLSNVGQAFITLTDFGNLNFLKNRTGDKIIRIVENGFSYA